MYAVDSIGRFDKGHRTHGFGIFPAVPQTGRQPGGLNKFGLYEESALWRFFHETVPGGIRFGSFKRIGRKVHQTRDIEFVVVAGVGHIAMLADEILSMMPGHYYND